MMQQLEIAYIEPDQVGTVVHVAVDGNYYGYIIINDIIKENSVSAIEGLKSAGVKKNIMLTGDSKRVADVVAKELGMDEVYSELLPANKVEQVEALLAN